MGHAISLGRDPRAVTEALVRHLRDAFMSLMAPELVILPSDQVDAIALRARELGPGVLVRAIELLGTTMVEMRLSPDPRILAEVALVQLTNDEAGTDVDALLARIERLENTVKQLREERPQGLAAVPAAPKDPATGRAVLGGAARAKPAAAPAVAAVAAAEPVAPATATATLTVPEAWEQTVKGQVKPIIRALYSAGTFVGKSGGTWQFSVPNEAHGAKCQEHRAAVESALTKVVGEPVTVEFVVGGRTHDDEPAPIARIASPQPVDDQPVEEIDLSELTDAPPEAVRTPIDRLAEAFPGSEFVAES
jgi:DNA polymerase-3 subunit gamma/tau